MCVQLGHDGLACPNPSARPYHITVVDITGIHDVLVSFCACGIAGSSEHYVQLLRHSWWPATSNKPRTAVSFNVLKQYHALALQGKLSMYDFYLSLARLMDNTGTEPMKVMYLSCSALLSLTVVYARYKEFSRVVRYFRHLRCAKRAGRAYDEAGLNNTAPGECAVECPLCPHHGRNLPTDIPEDQR